MPSRYVWTGSRYRDSQTGQYVAASVVRAEIDRALQNATTQAARLADDLRAGRISLESWRTLMRELVKEVHGYAAASAKGGWAGMDQQAWGQVGNLVRQEYGYLENFARSIAAGLPLDGRFTNRVKLYAQAARETYSRVERTTQQNAGKDEERNVLHPADHCAECVDLADQGWVPIGTLPPVGTRTCGRNCKCTISYREAA